MKKIRIAIVDDHDLFRDGIRLVLGQIQGFEVVFDTAGGVQFLNTLLEIRPDIVLMDIEMPGMKGVEVTRKALEMVPELKIIVLTMFTDEIHYLEMMKAGACGFILKKSNKFMLQQAIEEVYSGGTHFSQEIIRKLASRSMDKKHTGQDLLSDREKEVLSLICRGSTSKEIADSLFLSIKTVEAHRTNILHKASVRNTAELINWALKNNLVAID